MNRKKGQAFRRFLLAGVMAAAFSMSVYGDETTFARGTRVNGVEISEMTVEEAMAAMRDAYSNGYGLTIREADGSTETIQGAEIGFSPSFPDGFLEDILRQENETGHQSGPGAAIDYAVPLACDYNVDALNARLQTLGCVAGEDVVPTIDAHVSGYVEGEPFTIVPESQGNDVDMDLLRTAAQNAVYAGVWEIDLSASGCYRYPKVTRDSAELLVLLDTMNSCREMTVTYLFGENQEVLDAGTICSWLTGTQDGVIQVNRDLVAAYVQDLAARHNTAGTARVFHTATGRDVSVAGPYGWVINQEAETDALIDVIRTGQSQEREPVYSGVAADHSAQEWGATYVEVDLSGQHVYMTQNGAVVWDAPCVTGNTSKGHDTPAGIYSIAYKERDRVLRGKKLADGSYEYESPVSYWMPFNGGIGLHDANWRDSFGGTIYKTSGSHGCVNLPPSKVPALFDLVAAGMPVICYQ